MTINNKQKVTRTAKPKCKATPCGFACIAKGKKCSSNVLAANAAMLVSTITVGKAFARRTDGSHSDIKPIDTDLSRERAIDNKVSLNKQNLIDKLDQAQEIAEITGLTRQQAMLGVRAVRDVYSTAKYRYVKQIEQGQNLMTFSSLEKARLNKEINSIETLVKALPVYSGQIHRGLKFKSKKAKDEFLQSMSGEIALDTMSSFTSSSDVAKRFADGKYTVTLTVLNKSGSSISALSKYPKEDEVLVTKGTKYNVKQITQIKDTTVIELEERV